MAFQPIDRGTTPNDDTGDNPRLWALKENANFTELYAKTAGIFSITAYGADPAASPAANKVAIDAAMDDVIAAGGTRQGAVLHVPPGTFTSLPFNTQGANNLIISGSAYGTSVLKLAAGANADFLTFNAADLGLSNQQGCRIRDLTIDANGANQSGASNAVVVSSAWDMRLGPGFVIKNAYSDGLLWKTNGGSGCVQNSMNGFYIEGCGKGGTGYGIHFTENVQQIPMRDGILQWNKSGGIYYDTLTGSPATNLVGGIEEVYFEGIPGATQDYGVIYETPGLNSGLELLRCIFSGMSQAPIWMKGATTAGLTVRRCISGDTGGSYSVIIDTGASDYDLDRNSWDKALSIAGVSTSVDLRQRIADLIGLRGVDGSGISFYVGPTPAGSGAADHYTYLNGLRLCGGDAANTLYNGGDPIATSAAVRVGSLGVGNSASASTPGTVVKKIQVFDASGNSLGYVAVYDAIT